MERPATERGLSPDQAPLLALLALCATPRCSKQAVEQGIIDESKRSEYAKTLLEDGVAGTAEALAKRRRSRSHENAADKNSGRGRQGGCWADLSD